MYKTCKRSLAIISPPAKRLSICVLLEGAILACFIPIPVLFERSYLMSPSCATVTAYFTPRVRQSNSIPLNLSVLLCVTRPVTLIGQHYTSHTLKTCNLMGSVTSYDSLFLMSCPYVITIFHKLNTCLRMCTERQF